MTDFARLVLDADTRGLKRGERDLKGFTNTSADTARRVSASMLKVGAAVASAFAVSGGIGELIRVNAEFGASMQRVAAISGATAQELDQLRQTAMRLGSETQFSASQAADGLAFLAQAGFSAAEAMAAIPSVLDLAAASGLELAQAADIASNVLSGFGKEANEAGIASDILAAAASSTNTNVAQLGQAMSTVAPISAALGISMEETAAAIGVLSDAGIQGERAGTALRGVFASLAGVTPQAEAALRKYGLTAADVNPETQGLADAIGLLGERGLSTADAITIFGREAASGALVIADTAGRVHELTSDFENAEGAASEMAETMRDNLQGDIDSLKSAIEGLILSTGDAGATGAIRGMTQALTGLVRGLGEIIPLVGSAAAGYTAYRAVLLAGSAASAVAASSMAAHAAAALTLGGRMGLVTAATTAATGATRALTAALIANPFTAVAVAVGVLTAAFISLGNAQRQARAETNQLIGSLKGLAQARSQDFFTQRFKAEAELQREERELAALRGRQGGALPGRNTLIDERRRSSLDQDIANRERRIKTLRREIDGATEAYNKSTEAAKAIEVPATSAATAIASVGTASEKATGGIKGAGEGVDRLRAVLAKAFPETEKYRRLLEDLAVLDANLSGQELRRARAALVGANDNSSTDVSFRQGPLQAAQDVKNATELLGKTTEELADMAGTQTVRIEESFRTMSERILGSLRNLTQSIQSGDFFGILSGVLDVLVQIGSAGGFGEGIANNINRPIDGARANGGPVRGGGTYLVGERGPELFTPSASGHITANDNLGGSVTRVEVVPSPYFDTVVDGRIANAAPAIATAGGDIGVSKMQSMQNRRLG